MEKNSAYLEPSFCYCLMSLWHNCLFLLQLVFPLKTFSLVLGLPLDSYVCMFNPTSLNTGLTGFPIPWFLCPCFLSSHLPHCHLLFSCTTYIHLRWLLSLLTSVFQKKKKKNHTQITSFSFSPNWTFYSFEIVK